MFENGVTLVESQDRMGDMMEGLTAKDRELLNLLKANGREPVATLARLLGVSRTTVQDRLRKLEERGVIAGYSVRLGEAVERFDLKAFVTIEIEPRRSVEVSQTLGKWPAVEQLFTVSGKFDLVAMLCASSTQELDRLLDDVGSIAGVRGTESAIVLSTKLDRR